MTENIWIEDKNQESQFTYDKLWTKHNSDYSIERIRIVQYGHEANKKYTVFYMKIVKTDVYLNGDAIYAEDKPLSVSYIASLEEIFNEYDIENKNNNEIIKSIDDLY